jgi:hypothetical protein
VIGRHRTCRHARLLGLLLELGNWRIVIATDERRAEHKMKEGTKRSIVRVFHLVLAIPIVGYVYSPFEELPNYAPVVRFVAIPVLVLSGLWMWKGHLLRRLFTKSGDRSG